MQKPTFDPGITQQYTGQLRRVINKDGSFNVLQRGSGWQDWNPYLHLVQISWPAFFGIILLAYTLVNLAFAAVYYSLGPGTLQYSVAPGNDFERFLDGLFLSSHTLTTVGFGTLAPRSAMGNCVAAVEALVGLLGFAVATGLLFGRVSRPSARIGFSESVLIAPYQDGVSLQLRVVNRRRNTLMEVEATVMLMTVSREDGGLKRKYELLKLEREKVYFFPLTWTIVHIIDTDSPLYGKTPEDLSRAEAEFLILVKAWDETFSHTVHQRYSYRHDEIVWGARFTPAFEVSEDGTMIVNVDRVGSFAAVE